MRRTLRACTSPYGCLAVAGAGASAGAGAGAGTGRGDSGDGSGSTVTARLVTGDGKRLVSMRNGMCSTISHRYSASAVQKDTGRHSKRIYIYKGPKLKSKVCKVTFRKSCTASCLDQGDYRWLCSSAVQARREF
jgi:hypothetical protein